MAVRLRVELRERVREISAAGHSVFFRDFHRQHAAAGLALLLSANVA